MSLCAPHASLYTLLKHNSDELNPRDRKPESPRPPIPPRRRSHLNGYCDGASQAKATPTYGVVVATMRTKTKAACGLRGDDGAVVLYLSAEALPVRELSQQGILYLLRVVQMVLSYSYL